MSESPSTQDAEELAIALRNFSKYFRSETLVTETDLRVDVANSLYRSVLGNETVDTVTHDTHLRGDFVQIAGERDRTAGSYERSTDNDETFVIDGSCTETVNGRDDRQGRVCRRSPWSAAPTPIRSPAHTCASQHGATNWCGEDGWRLIWCGWRWPE